MHTAPTRAAPSRLRLLPPPEPTARRLARRATLAVVAAHLALATVSGYRAVVQVYRVRVHPPAAPLAPGARVAVDAVTSGRTTVTMRLELRQGARAALLGVLEVPGNREGVYDPRPRRATLAATLAPETLRPFASGPAELRAVATGRAQWMRVPPPTVAAVPVILRPE